MNSGISRPKVLILTNIPTPNQLDFFNVLGERNQIELTVVFCAKLESNRHWNLDLTNLKFRTVFLPGLTIGQDMHLNPGIVPYLINNRFDTYILSGSYTMPTFQIASFIVGFLGRQWVYWGEALRFSEMGSLQGTIRHRLQSSLLKAHRIFSIGSFGIESFTRIGYPIEKLSVFPYVEDTDRFKTSNDVPEHSDGLIRFLFVGQLIPRKGIHVLLEACTVLATESNQFHLEIIGSGELYKEIIQFIQSNQLQDFIHVNQFMEPAKLPERFRAADVFVLPSLYDGWGLVINEAMAASLPIITTDSVGAGRDLVADEFNGYVVNTGDAYSLYRAMKYFMDNPGLASSMGYNSLRLISQWTPSVAAEHLEAFCREGLPTQIFPLISNEAFTPFEMR